jgi:cytochrome oxidase Cu insertion factor (SCO1/SenC/PrrC family)
MEMKYSKLKLGLAALVLASLAAVPSIASAASVRQPPSSVGASTLTPVPSNVANAKFENQNGTPETLASLKGKTIFLVPLLTLCGDTCPFTSGNLLGLQNILNAAKASNVAVVAIDVDPYRDTVHRIAAYAKIVGGDFQIWTEQGPTSTPLLTKKDLAEKNPVGTGDVNANLLAIEKFFGWTVQVVPQGTPPSTDWLAPHEKLTYDIQHSDGFWVINPKLQVRFVSGDLPAFTGTLSKTLATFMGYKSNIYKVPVYKRGWTVAQGLQAIEWVDQKTY